MAYLFVNIRDGEIVGLMGLSSNCEYCLEGLNILKFRKQSESEQSIFKALIPNEIDKMFGTFHVEVTDEEIKSLDEHQFNSDFVKEFLFKILPPELWL